MKIYILVFTALFLASCTSESENKDDETGPSAEEIKAEERKKKQKEGYEIVQTSFKTLSGQLKKSMKEGGVENALKYCNIEAYPLTDSLSEAYNVQIKRTALNWRNPNNAPTPDETTLMEHYKTLVDQKIEVSDTIVHQNGKYTYYNPILLMENCRKCHGKPGVQIAENDFKIINELYPKDQAINFSTGDLRGMWVVEWNK